MTTYWRRARKTTWPPCVHPDCTAPMGGRLGGSGNVTPARLSGARFGIDGVLCHNCWNRCHQRAQTEERRRLTGVVRRSRWDKEAA